jgi:predicted deacylase
MTLKIHDEIIEPGTSKTILLPTPKLYDWTPMHMPVHVIRSKKKGPIVCITAAVHGDEINGVEIVRELLKKKIHLLKGSLIAVPIVNVYGFLSQNRYLVDRRDLNRSFPGSSHGSLASRLAHLVITELVSQSTHLIDLHSGSLQRHNFPQVRANLTRAADKKLALAFNAPVTIHAKERDGSLRQAASEKNIPCILYEAGEALRFNNRSIKQGITGIMNVLQSLGMISQPKEKSSTMIALSSYWVRSPYSGTMRTAKSMLGKEVRKGETLAIIANPLGAEEYRLIAPSHGIIIGKSNLPLVHAGAALFHIASFEEQHAEESHDDEHHLLDH